MDFELNLLENSLDYLNESLGYYKDIGYEESHDKDRNTIEDKRKWKTTFILLVQAMELLLKYSLTKINEVLVYENIDEKISEDSKTISYSKSITRLKNLKPKLLIASDIEILTSCGKIRNDCIHYKVNLNSCDIKKKYCKLFQLYMKTYYNIFHKKYKNDNYNYVIDNILTNAKNLYIYRGIEFRKKSLERFKKDLETNQYNSFLLNKSGEAYRRVKYSYEKYFGNYSKDEAFVFDSCLYCGDCGAKKGEVHLDGCDWEVCPKCKEQLLICECGWEKYISEDYIETHKIRKVVDYEDNINYKEAKNGINKM